MEKRSLVSVMRDHPGIMVKFYWNLPDILAVKLIDLYEVRTYVKYVHYEDFEKEVDEKGLGGYLQDEFNILKEG